MANVRNKPNNTTIAAGLLLAVFIWGANNAATKFIVSAWPGKSTAETWPPNFAGSTRFLAAGLILLALLRWTKWFGETHPVTPELNRRLWWRGGLSLAVYIVTFNCALKLTTLSHVALYLGASPVWALLLEGWPERNWKSARRYGAAALAFCGVLILLWPSLRNGAGSLTGELLGFACGPLWTNFGSQCRRLGRDLSGAEVSAHTFWRAGLILAPFAAGELLTRAVPARTSLILAQLVCVLGGSVAAFAIWNSALRHWQTSRVFLFNNLIPLSSTAWAYFCLGEQLSPTFWPSMICIGAGVCLGQANSLCNLFCARKKSPA
jgi:drug/metabolite transporter (DMT)-like permease